MIEAIATVLVVAFVPAAMLLGLLLSAGLFVAAMAEAAGDGRVSPRLDPGH